jgi:hypothetical protein
MKAQVSSADFGPLTVKSQPPGKTRQKRSYWPQVLAEGRLVPGEWIRTSRPHKRSTAQQVASDIRNAHHRDLTKTRIRGLLVGDLWETQWGRDPEVSGTDQYFIWLRYHGVTEDERVRLLDDLAWHS